jgi:hypothetical protein
VSTCRNVSSEWRCLFKHKEDEQEHEEQDEDDSSADQKSADDEQLLPNDDDTAKEDDSQSSSSSELDEAATMAIPAPQERNELINPFWTESKDLGNGPTVPLPPEENQFFQVRTS